MPQREANSTALVLYYYTGSIKKGGVEERQSHDEYT